MRTRLALLLAAAAAVPATFAATPAHAYCDPDFGTYCAVQCLLSGNHHVDPKDLNRTLRNFVPYCTN